MALSALIYALVTLDAYITIKCAGGSQALIQAVLWPYYMTKRCAEYFVNLK